MVGFLPLEGEPLLMLFDDWMEGMCPLDGDEF